MTGRALPGPVLDLIRDGVPKAMLRRQSCGGDCAVERALVSTASSAQQRAWSEPEWCAILDDPRSYLGVQSKIERGRSLSAKRHRDRLAYAWRQAERWLNTRPAAWSKVEIIEHVLDVRIFADDALLTDAERKVLSFACDVAEKVGTMRPALPWRQVRDATSLSEHVTKSTLDTLCTLGLLTLVQHGRPARAESRRRSNLFALPTPQAMTAYTLIPGRVPRPVGDSARPVGGQDFAPVGARQTYGRLGDDEKMITLTFGSPEAFTRALELLRENGVPVEPAELPEGVVPIRPEDRISRERERT